MRRQGALLLALLGVGTATGCNSSQAPLATTGGSSGAGPSSGTTSSGASSSGSTSSGTAGTSTSGTSTGGGSTSGGSTGGSTGGTGTSTGAVLLGDGGCGGAGVTLSACATSADCQCPAECVVDPALVPYLPFSTTKGECEVPCVDGGCVDAFNVCRDGFCSPNVCGQPPPDGGNFGAGIWLVCDAGGALDGTCVFVPGVLSNDQNTLLNGFYCVQGGTSDGGCDRAATRQSPDGTRCLPGLSCPQTLDGDAGCQQKCDQSVVPTTCQSGFQCAPTGDQFGVCYATGTGGCSTGLSSGESQACSSALDCGCPQQCVQNAHLGGKVCEVPCQTAAGCDQDDAHCSGGFCEINYCAADPLGQVLPGQLDGPCVVDDGGPGTCIPFGQFVIDATTPEFGVCFRSGSATTACSTPFGLTTPLPPAAEPGLALPPSALCAAGSTCVSGSCTAVCNPVDGGVDSGCPVGQVCIEQAGDPITHFGACGACLVKGSNCSLDGDCCSGSCSFFSCQ